MILSDLFDDPQRAMRSMIMNAIEEGHLSTVETLLEQETIGIETLYLCAWQSGVQGQCRIGECLSKELGSTQPYFDGLLIRMIHEGASIQDIVDHCKDRPDGTWGADIHQDNDLCMLVAAEEGRRDLFFFMLEVGLDPNKAFDEMAIQQLEERVQAYVETDCSIEKSKQQGRLHILKMLEPTQEFHKRVGDAQCDDLSLRCE